MFFLHQSVFFRFAPVCDQLNIDWNSTLTDWYEDARLINIYVSGSEKTANAGFYWCRHKPTQQSPVWGPHQRNTNQHLHLLHTQEHEAAYDYICFLVFNSFGQFSKTGHIAADNTPQGNGNKLQIKEERTGLVFLVSCCENYIWFWTVLLHSVTKRRSSESGGLRLMLQFVEWNKESWRQRHLQLKAEDTFHIQFIH